MATKTEHANAMMDAFNKGDLDGFMALVGDASYDEIATGRSVSGGDYKDAIAGWRTAFPDVTGTVTNSYESGNQLIQEVTWQGTNTGPMATPEGEIPPTGKTQTTQAAWVLDYDGDTLKSTRHYFDMLGMLKQLGLA